MSSHTKSSGTTASGTTASDAVSAERRRATVDLVSTEVGPGPAAGTQPDTSLLRRTQRGMVSAEWTVGIIAAIAIAGVLLAVVTAGPVEKLLLNVILTIIKSFTKGL